MPPTLVAVAACCDFHILQVRGSEFSFSVAFVVILSKMSCLSFLLLSRQFSRCPSILELLIRINSFCGYRFKHTNTPANLVMLYFEEPDTAAHVFGPESVEVLDYIQKVVIYLFIFICLLACSLFMQ
jgi:predicted AlkP superfamily pyrophosphatase or phosphodiesterase